MFKQQHQHIEHDDIHQLRQEAGRWLRGLREKAGFSQRELANRVGLEYYTFISQIESGRGRVPPAQTRQWAEALGVPTRRFAIELMRFYDPVHHALIFGPDARNDEGDEVIEAMEERLSRLEKLLANEKGAAG